MAVMPYPVFEIYTYGLYLPVDSADWALTAKLVNINNIISRTLFKVVCLLAKQCFIFVLCYFRKLFCSIKVLLTINRPLTSFHTMKSYNKLVNLAIIQGF